MQSSGAHDPTATGEVRTLVVDDSAVFLAVATEVVRSTPGCRSVGAVSTPGEALELLVRERPELVLVDVQMPQIDGIELTRRIKALRPSTAVALISAHAPDQLPPGAFSCGADVVLDKRELGPRRLRELTLELERSGTG